MDVAPAHPNAFDDGRHQVLHPTPTQGTGAGDCALEFSHDADASPLGLCAGRRQQGHGEAIRTHTTHRRLDCQRGGRSLACRGGQSHLGRGRRERVFDTPALPAHLLHRRHRHRAQGDACRGRQLGIRHPRTRRKKPGHCGRHSACGGRGQAFGLGEVSEQRTSVHLAGLPPRGRRHCRSVG